LFAVVLATLGTFMVVYGGVVAPKDSEGLTTTMNPSHRPSAPLIGNVLALIASFGYGLYQVLYKIYAALPSDPDVATERLYEEIPEDEAEAAVERVDKTDAVYPPPFGLHPNFITSVLGFFTFIMLWIPLPFLHWSGAEPFLLPPNRWTALTIAGIALTGLTFNAGFMVAISSIFIVSSSKLLLVFTRFC
jgi:drug/metabolite transporter (DMT)-like permease